MRVDLRFWNVINKVGLEKDGFTGDIQVEQFETVPQDAREFFGVLGRPQDCDTGARGPAVVVVARHKEGQGSRGPGGDSRASLQVLRGESYNHLERVAGGCAVQRQRGNSQGRSVVCLIRLCEGLQVMLQWGYRLVVGIKCKD